MIRKPFRSSGVVLMAAFVSQGLLLSHSALAQITSGASSTSSSNFFATATPPSTFSSFNLTATNFSTVNFTGSSGSESLYVTGDWDLNLARADVGGGGVNTDGFLPFTVGNVPVQMSNFQFAVNAKWVNGGGDASIPAIKGYEWVFLKEQLGANPAPGDITVASVSLVPAVTLTGNGYVIYGPQTTAGTPSTYVLAANRTYYMDIASTTFISTTGFNVNTTPSITVTNEFGGTFGDSFTGLNASFDWVKVPEPSSWVMGLSAAAGMASFGLLKRRRAIMA